MVKQPIRCAIYTRKSSEEGLDQSFNSLAAQREACRDFILSQKHEGWLVLSEMYDDGGISGGTMERPALKQILADIQAGAIDAIVVYKVDRLTRSLTDFAKIIEIFDAHNVSFVSVTQQFNTTSSMGRLTLNVLLSFAQFEREITGERIRDKIAASKKKGIWMGGTVPLGYDCIERRLVINPTEAAIVRKIFNAYLRTGCLTKLKGHLDDRFVRSKLRGGNVGRKSGGVSYSRGALHHLLCNRIYLGEIVHRDQHFPGQHKPIVPKKLWNDVASLLRAKDQAQRKGSSSSSPSLLTGKLFDSRGVRFTPTHCKKNGKRYRYYTSRAVIQPGYAKPRTARIPAQQLDDLVNSLFHELLLSPATFAHHIGTGETRDLINTHAKDMADEWSQLALASRCDVVNKSLVGVIVGESQIRVEIGKAKLIECLLGGTIKGAADLPDETAKIELTADFGTARRGCEIILAPTSRNSKQVATVPSILKAVARARDWYEKIVDGEFKTIEQLAKNSGLTKRYVRKVLLCARMSPQVIEALLAGKHRPDLTLKRVLHRIPLDWSEQRREFLG